MVTIVDGTINKTDENIIQALDKLSQSQRLFLWDIAKKEGLSPIQIQFVEYIQKMRLSDATITNLAREFDLTKATVSDSIRVLVKKGLLEKIADEHDKRKFYLKLTESMQEKMALINRRSFVLREMIKDVPDEQKQVIAGFLMDLIKNLYGAGYIQAARMCLTCSNFVANAKEGEEKRHYCKFSDIYVSDSELSFNCQAYGPGKTVNKKQ